jgi:HK97 family phage major capsid protein
MPDNGDSAPATSFVVFGDLKRCVLFGDRQSLQVMLLKEATIDGTNLAEFDLIGLRFVERLDIEVGLPNGLAILKTAAV